MDTTKYVATGNIIKKQVVHVLRYLLGSIENEQYLSWNKRMHRTIQKMIHYAKQTNTRDEEVVKQLLQE